MIEDVTNLHCSQRLKDMFFQVFFIPWRCFVMLKENLSFVGICVLVFAALLGLAYLFERTVCRDLQRRSRSRNISYVAMFSALGGVLMLLEIPLFFAPGFYKIDLSELPVLMSAFYLGPVAGVITELLKVLLKLLLKGTSTAFVGDFANFVVGCTFVLPAAVIYHHHKTRRTAIIGMAVGTLCMTVFGSLFNALYLIPKFAELFHLPIDQIVAMGTAVNKGITSVPTLVLFAVVPFNLIKGIVDSALTYLLYKRAEFLLFPELRKKEKVQPQVQSKNPTPQH
jgi:hypothetical protein